MEIEEKRNPNSWSELPLDLSISIFGRLGFADFRRAKSVCSSWHSASKQSVPRKNQIHWLILFPKDNNGCTFLFNPEEKDKKLYKARDLGFEESSVCLATYESWLLMMRDYTNLYIVNLFTKEMINLPFYNHQGSRGSPVFWIDDKTKDYVVLFGRLGGPNENFDVVYSSSNNNLLWNQIPETSNCVSLVYKDHKLYVLSLRKFKIFDFREKIPKETFRWGAIVGRLRLGIPRPTQLVVSLTKGREVAFQVEKFFRPRSRTYHFQIVMIYSLGFLKKKPQLVECLGDEAILLDQGITVLANEGGGFVRNSIYYSDSKHNLFRFDLETRKSEPLHEFDSSSVQFSGARWFLPTSFTHT